MKDNINALKFMLKFTKNTRVLYLFGLLFFTSQIFIANFVQASFMRVLTESVIKMNSENLLDGILFCSLLFLFQIVIVLLGIILYNISSIRIEKNFKVCVFKSFLRKKDESNNTTEAISKINKDSDLALNALGNTFASMAFSFFTILGSSIVIAIIDIRILFLQIIIGIISFIVQTKYSGAVKSVTARELELHEESLKIVTSILRGNETIRANNYQEFSILKYSERLTNMYKESYKKVWIFTSQHALKTVFGKFTLIGIFVVGTYFVLNKTLEFSYFVMLPTMCMGITDATSSLGRQYTALQGPLIAAKRIQAVVNSDVFEYNDNFVERFKEVIKVKGLSLVYGKEIIYEDVSFDINCGEFVILIGKSGSGKSSLLKTILGLNKIQSGEITLDNQRLTVSELESWKSNFSYVDQECRMFNMSIKDNITLLNDDILVTDINDAIKLAKLDSFIVGLNDGYNTILDEKNDNISGGEKQRIALARAAVRKAPIILLDEFTSALDKKTEHQLFEDVSKLKGKYTIILSTHNKEYFHLADKVINLDDYRPSSKWISYT